MKDLKVRCVYTTTVEFSTSHLSELHLVMTSVYKLWCSLTWVLVTVVLVKAKRTKRDYSQISWSDCGGPDKIIHITSLGLTPMPVILPGVMHITYNAYTSGTIANAELKLSIKRETFFGFITVPCIFNIGSCHYDDMCTLLDTMKSEDWLGIARDLANQVSGLFQSSNIDVTCPVQPTNMAVHNYPFQLPELPTLLTFFADGNYKVQFEIIEISTQKQLGCFNVNLSMKKAETQGWFFRKRR